MVKKALYLSGGGARGAYQAGALKALNTILQTKTFPFDMLSGVSVGSINAAVLANYAHDFPSGIEVLESLWGEIHCDQVFNSSNRALTTSVIQNLGSLLLRQRKAGHLLDTTPFVQFLEEWIDFAKIETNIANGHLETLEILANCYELERTISFYNHNNPSFEDWLYPRHASQKTTIQSLHIQASTALPIFFPTINIDNLHYSDGSMGLITPLRGAIRFKMDKILVIGTRQQTNPVVLEQLSNKDIGFGYILGAMLDGIFIDTLDHDIDMVNRMNEIAVLLSMWKKRHAKWRPIQINQLRPSIDLSLIAKTNYPSMPFLLRFLLNIMGSKNSSSELISFLLFEGAFTRKLIDLGYKDTMDRASEIEAFFVG